MCRMRAVDEWTTFGQDKKTIHFFLEINIISRKRCEMEFRKYVKEVFNYLFGGDRDFTSWSLLEFLRCTLNGTDAIFF